MPASSPASSEAWPTCGETDVMLCWVKVSGSEPYLRTSASWFAWASVNPFGCGPVISNEPEVSAPLVSGADCTSPSSTIPIWSSVASFEGTPSAMPSASAVG